MKLTREDIDFAKNGILFHLNDAIQHLYDHLDDKPQEEGNPLHRTRARYRLNAIGYILTDLKRHLHNDELTDATGQEDWEALDMGDIPLLSASPEREKD